MCSPKKSFEVLTAYPNESRYLLERSQVEKGPLHISNHKFHKLWNIDGFIFPMLFNSEIYTDGFPDDVQSTEILLY